MFHAHAPRFLARTIMSTAITVMAIAMAPKPHQLIE